MFRLYQKEDRGVMPFGDYGAIIDTVRHLLGQYDGAVTCLEFGPGYSTYALIEGGATLIDTYEHHDGWRAKMGAMLADHEPVVKLMAYKDEPLINLSDAGGRCAHYTLALVDSPVGREGKRREHPGDEGCARKNTLAYALNKARYVLLHDAQRPAEQESLARLGVLHCTTMITPTLGLIERYPL